MIVDAVGNGSAACFKSFGGQSAIYIHDLPWSLREKISLFSPEVMLPVLGFQLRLKLP
jgi:hypothetical protein